MFALNLSEKEVAALIGALESHLSDLATERVGTDNRELHAELKDREALLAEILKRLGDLRS
ncbi:MAG TPA: hypothetical protein VFF53_02485 [Geobacteraceae bacterium]|nr:hypothetical protein [Geobacteraceae bacterium]